MAEYSVHQLKPEDFDILIPLMEDCFGISVNVGYFRWKFLQNPAGAVVGFYALSESGECAAYYGAIPENYVVNGSPRTIYQSCDTMTHSRHRRKGLFQKLATTCYGFLESNNALFVIGFGGGQSTPGFLKFGWKHIFDISFHFKPRPVCRLQMMVNKLQLTPSSDHYKIVHLSTPDTIIDQIKRGGNKGTIHLNRSSGFIKWRLSNPMHQYQVIALIENENQIGYCVYYTEGDKMMLLDAYCAKDNLIAKLLNELNTIVINNGHKGIITFAQRKTQLSKQLLSNGFLINPFKFGPLHQPLPFIFYADRETLDNYKDARNWSITALDHDAF